ncbi:hypothetical protein DRN43_02705 [Thermococci archaeon]|uniref:PCNA-inhibitor n=1 Tax=Palaeococcus sp. (in: euryarchaeotes) TaxID=2820298 RepID=UPI000F200E28|nr:PCNA-inhibitor [Palaeococcus sp. (in: euryarchaeotes)]MCD6559835.1 hypothetical protein [Palaeococcus sp. (in: euryarchaeotes)]RLF78504.1 MAG: hypothetical protein DRN39_00960 [Thermococci archaeon]RLF89982.1 MAG: hypothetical protein DRN43_02705 [Thermococci archaeon]
MDKTLDEFLNNGAPRSREDGARVKRKKLRDTNLDSFLPEEHVNFFKSLRIGSKKIRRARILEE